MRKGCCLNNVQVQPAYVGKLGIDKDYLPPDCQNFYNDLPESANSNNSNARDRK